MTARHLGLYLPGLLMETILNFPILKIERNLFHKLLSILLVARLFFLNDTSYTVGIIIIIQQVHS